MEINFLKKLKVVVDISKENYVCPQCFYYRPQDIAKQGETNRIRLCFFIPDEGWVSLDLE